MLGPETKTGSRVRVGIRGRDIYTIVMCKRLAKMQKVDQHIRILPRAPPNLAVNPS